MQVVSTICLYLADKVMIHVLDETFPMMVWSKLEELYMTKSLTNTLFFWRQFYQLRMIEGQSVQEHLSYFQKSSLTSSALVKMLRRRPGHWFC